MLKFAMLFVLSFGSVAAVANAAQPMEHEVFANAGALSVERLTAEQMQETDGELLPVLAVQALVLTGRLAVWAVGTYAGSYAYEKYSPTVNPILEDTYDRAVDSTLEALDATSEAFTRAGDAHMEIIKARTAVQLEVTSKLLGFPKESKPEESKPEASSSKKGSSGSSSSGGSSSGYRGSSIPPASPVINYRTSTPSKPKWTGRVTVIELPRNWRETGHSSYSSRSNYGYRGGYLSRYRSRGGGGACGYWAFSCS